MSTDESPIPPAWALEGRDLARQYRVERGLFGTPAVVHALGGVSLDLAPGRTLAVVGESGSGKSTLARLLALIEPPSAGSLHLGGQDALAVKPAARRALRRQVQMVFQNPYGALNPRQTIGAALAEPLAVNSSLPRAAREARAREMLDRVGLSADSFQRYPHMFSGGQRQRVAIARALMLQPQVVVLDEPVSALDVSIRAQVLNLLADLQEQFALAYVFISHDLGVVQHLADEVMVMYLGRVVEQAPCKVLFARPRHPYTQALLSATPRARIGPRVDRIVLRGEPPSPLAPPGGCAFHPRCALARPECAVRAQRLVRVGDAAVACAVVAPG